MKGYKPQMSFDATVAHEYVGTVRGDETVAVECLRRWAGRGPVLELAVGGGRIALPLAAAGVTVEGVDFSQAMLDELRRQPGAERVKTSLGNIVDFAVPVRSV